MMTEPFLRFDNILSDRDLKLVDEEIPKLTDKYTPRYFESTEIYRVDLDKVFSSDRQESSILGVMGGLLYGDIVDKDIVRSHDLSYTLYKMPHQYNTHLSQMRESTDYRWHIDTSVDDVTFMSFIFYVNDNFKGGELIIDDGYKKHIIKPKRNTLILMPSHYLHKINSPKYDDGLENYRTTINGFMRFRRG